MKRYVMSPDSQNEAFCTYCGTRYFADRSTARYCSDKCKVAAHRANKAKKEVFKNIAKSIKSLADELENKETSYSAAITLDSLRRTLDMYFPPKTRWWRCDECGKAVMKFLPESVDCPCAGKAKWYIQAL